MPIPCSQPNSPRQARSRKPVARALSAAAGAFPLRVGCAAVGHTPDDTADTRRAGSRGRNWPECGQYKRSSRRAAAGDWVRPAVLRAAIFAAPTCGLLDCQADFFPVRRVERAVERHTHLLRLFPQPVRFGGGGLIVFLGFCKLARAWRVSRKRTSRRVSGFLVDAPTRFLPKAQATW